MKSIKFQVLVEFESSLLMPINVLRFVIFTSLLFSLKRSRLTARRPRRMFSCFRGAEGNRTPVLMEINTNGYFRRVAVLVWTQSLSLKLIYIAFRQLVGRFYTRYHASS
jgi:hypothetical protein